MVMWKIKALALKVEKILASLKFQTELQKGRITELQQTEQKQDAPAPFDRV